MTSRTPDASGVYAAQEARQKAQADADQQILDAFAGRDRTREARDKQALDALNGRTEDAQTKAAQQVHDAFTGRDPEADAWTERNHNAWHGLKDKFHEAEDAMVINALKGKAPANADPLWIERAEVNKAAEAYRDARLKSLPRSETLDSAALEAERERDRYIDAHRAGHATEANLLDATATHLTGLAAAYNRTGSVRASAAPAASRTVESTPTTSRKVTRISGDGGRLDKSN
jgi:murein L,D-transpeptidase YcbB/YkuD